jgi:hypothetical protein
MVTKPNTPTPANGQEPLKTLPKVAPAELATNASQNPKYAPRGEYAAPVQEPSTSVARKDVANSDKTAQSKFTLPDKVTQKEIRDNSFHYGGGRSAGNRSLSDNRKRQEKQP